MRFLAVHPGPLMYTKVFLRLEPLGLELVAEAARKSGHEARLIDLQVERHQDYFRLIDDWRPDVIAFSCNYLANVPEIIDLAKATKARLPSCFLFVGGHSASFTAQECYMGQVWRHYKPHYLRGFGGRIWNRVYNRRLHRSIERATLPSGIPRWGRDCHHDEQGRGREAQRNS